MQGITKTQHENEGESPPPDEAPPRKPRGFGALSPERRRELASLGGKAAHAQGAGHQFDVEEARIAGRKGGAKVARDRAHMAAIGRLGGAARGRAAAKRGKS